MPNINIDASHTTLTPSMTDYIEKKINGLQKILREENTVHVELDVDNKKHTGPKYLVRITILPKAGIYASCMGGDLYEALDLAIPKIKEQLVKQKDKEISQRRKLGAKRKISEE